MIIKALTLWQPYAQAIVAGLKKYETRSWATRHRGKIAIHASAKTLSKEYRALADKYGLTDGPDGMPLGKILAICELEECILMDEDFIGQQPQTEIDLGDWRTGRYAWKLNALAIMPEAKPARGYQGLWNLDSKILGLP
jgi:hypothetical protein